MYTVCIVNSCCGVVSECHCFGFSCPKCTTLTLRVLEMERKSKSWFVQLAWFFFFFFPHPSVRPESWAQKWLNAGDFTHFQESAVWITLTSLLLACRLVSLLFLLCLESTFFFKFFIFNKMLTWNVPDSGLIVQTVH